MRYDLVAGDIEPVYADFLSGGPFPDNVTLALTFTMAQVNGTKHVTGPAVIVDHTKKRVPVYYQWQAGNTDTPGIYRAQWKLLLDGLPMTWPSDDTLWIVIRPRVQERNRMTTAKLVAVTTDPVLLYQADGPDSETVIFDNHGSADVTLGGPDVTAGNGPTLKASDPPMIFQMYEDGIYGVTASSTANVAILATLSQH